MAKVYKRIAEAALEGSARTALGLGSNETITVRALRDVLASRFCERFNTTVGQLIVDEGLWDMAMELARDTDPRISFRASWALEWAYTVRPDEITKRLDTFFETFATSPCESVQRVYSKMLCDMLRRGAVALTDEKAERTATRCFDLLTSPDTPVAVMVWQIELLSDLRNRFDWIADNLTDIVRHLSESPDCTPGMAATARRYLRNIAAANRSGRSLHKRE